MRSNKSMKKAIPILPELSGFLNERLSTPFPGNRGFKNSDRCFSVKRLIIAFVSNSRFLLNCQGVSRTSQLPGKGLFSWNENLKMQTTMSLKKIFYFYLAGFLSFLFLFSSFSFAQENSCIPIENSTNCQVFYPDSGWTIVHCEYDIRCKGWDQGDVQFYEKLCIKDSQNQRYCHVNDQYGSTRVLCSSEPACSQHVPFQTFSGNADSRKNNLGKGDFFPSHESLFNEMQEGAIKQQRDPIQKISEEQSYIQQERKKVLTRFIQPTLKKVDEILLSTELTDEDKLKKLYEIARKIVPSVKDYVENYTGLSHTKGIASIEAAEDGIRYLQLNILNKLFIFRSKILKKEKDEELRDVFSGKDPKWNEKIRQIISETEKDIRNALDDLEEIFFPSEKDKYIKYDKEKRLQNEISKMEELLYETTKKLMNEDLNTSLSDLQKNIETAHSSVETSTQLTKTIETKPIVSEFSSSDYYDRNVENMTLEILKSKYEKEDMRFLEKEDTFQTDEQPYEFQSPEGEFLKRVKALHSKLSSATPFNEQGILAKEIGLQAVKMADQEYANGDQEKAEAALHIGEAVSDIAIGFLLPPVSFGKDIYELITGKHLLTGRTLTSFERVLSFIGACTFGVASGATKLVQSSVKQADILIELLGDSGLSKKLAKKLGKKPGAKTSKKSLYALLGAGKDNSALRKALKNTDITDKEILKSKEFREALKDAVKNNIKAYANALEEIGIRTQKERNAAAAFLQKVFKENDGTIDDMVEVIQAVGKEGIENYTKLIKTGTSLSKELKEDLARYLLNQSRKFLTLSTKELERYGELGKIAKAAGVNTEKELHSAVYFLTKLFPQGNISAQEMTKIMASVNKFDLPKYTEVLGQMAFKGKLFSPEKAKELATYLMEQSKLGGVRKNNLFNKAKEIYEANLTYKAKVIFSSKAKKTFENKTSTIAPRLIQKAEAWIEEAKVKGLAYVRNQSKEEAAKGYKPHPLTGAKKGLDSIWLNDTYRMTYTIDKKTKTIHIDDITRHYND